MEEHESIQTEANEKKPSRKFVIIGGIISAAIFFFFMLPCTAMKLTAISVRGRALSLFCQLDIAILSYKQETGSYPASLDTLVATEYSSMDIPKFVREDKVDYFVPKPDSPSTFTILEMSTPLGPWAMPLDGDAHSIKFKTQSHAP